MKIILVFLGILLLVLLIGVVLSSMAVGFSFLLFKAFGRSSGLEKLWKKYPALEVPEGEKYMRQWVAVGMVYFKRSAEVVISSKGLYLWVKPFLSKYKPVLLPWKEINHPRESLMYWGKAVRVAIGEPPITSLVFRENLFNKMIPYLGGRVKVEKVNLA